MYTIITEKIKRDWNVIEEFVYSFALQTGNESSVDRDRKSALPFKSPPKLNPLLTCVSPWLVSGSLWCTTFLFVILLDTSMLS